MKDKIDFMREWSPPKNDDELAKVVDSCVDIVIPLVKDFRDDRYLQMAKFLKAFELLKFEAYNYKGPANLFKYHVSNIIRKRLKKLKEI